MMEASSKTCRLDERILRDVSRELGISGKTLLAAVVLEFRTLPKKKQLEIIGDYFTRLSDEEVFLGNKLE